MNENEQVQEMARCLEMHTCMSGFQAEIGAKVLYSKGYRKASEVAREIFEGLQGLLIMRIGVNQAIAELKKRYTEGEK